MKIATSRQMKEIDEKTINDLGVSSLILMENAANQLLLVCEDMLEENIYGKTFIIFCGTGNNGGDGMALSRLLFSRGAHPIVIILGDLSKLSTDAKEQYEIIRKYNITIYNFKDKFENINYPFDCIVDAMLGTGSRGELRGLYKDCAEWINKSNIPVLSVDIPTGISTDNGKIENISVKAKRTVTFGLPQPGHILYPGTEYVGELNAVNIGFPQSYLNDNMIKLNMLLFTEAASMLPVYPENISKDARGRILVVGGASGMSGAVILAAKSAQITGSGIVYTFSGNNSFSAVENNSIETINYSYKESHLTNKDVEIIKQIAVRCSAAAIGPGLGVHPETLPAYLRLIKEIKKPMIIDADGINLLKDNMDILDNIKETIILTPHLKEFSRISGFSEDEINENLLDITSRFAVKWNIILLLKGFRTIVSFPDGEQYIIPVGKKVLATGGSGDVLTGIITALYGMTENAKISVLGGAFIHGLTGEILYKKVGEYGATSVNIMNTIPDALKRLRGME